MKLILTFTLTLWHLTSLAQTAPMPDSTLRGFWGINFGSSLAFTKTKMLEKKVLLRKDALLPYKYASGKPFVFSFNYADSISFDFVQNEMAKASVYFRCKEGDAEKKFLKIYEDINKRYGKGLLIDSIRPPFDVPGDLRDNAIMIGEYGAYFAKWNFKSTEICLKIESTEEDSFICLSYIDRNRFEKLKSKITEFSDY